MKKVPILWTNSIDRMGTKGGRRGVKIQKKCGRTSWKLLRQARRRAWRVQSACGICQFYGPRQAKFANKEVHLRTLGSDMRRETPKVISMAHPNPSRNMHSELFLRSEFSPYDALSA